MSCSLTDQFLVSFYTVQIQFQVGLCAMAAVSRARKTLLKHKNKV